MIKKCNFIIDQIQCREEQERLVGLFVGAAFLDWRRADAERVEALDGLVNRGKEWFDFLEGLVRRQLTDPARGVERKSENFESGKRKWGSGED